MDVDGVSHRVKNLLNLVSPVKSRKIHWQLRESLCDLVKLTEVVVEVQETELLHHGPDQPHVLDLEAAPEGADPLLAQVNAVLGHEGGLAAPRPPRDHRHLPPPEPLQGLVEFVKPGPLDPFHLIRVQKLQENIVSERIKVCDVLM